MIVANIKDCEKYCSIHPAFREVFDFLRSLSKDSSEGVSGNGYKVNFSGKYCETCDTGAGESKKPFEAHKDYIDIHYCIDGSEGIGYNDVSRLRATTEYNAADDYYLLEGEYSKIVLREGDFCVVFPEDAHIPMMSGAVAGPLLKAVAKVRVK